MPIRSQFETEAEWLDHLRSWFAGQALAGQLASFANATWLDAAIAAAETRGIGFPEHVAGSCYDLADAMLAEREKAKA